MGPSSGWSEKDASVNLCISKILPSSWLPLSLLSPSSFYLLILPLSVGTPFGVRDWCYNFLHMHCLDIILFTLNHSYVVHQIDRYIGFRFLPSDAKVLWNFGLFMLYFYTLMLLPILYSLLPQSKYFYFLLLNIIT